MNEVFQPPFHSVIHYIHELSTLLRITAFLISFLFLTSDPYFIGCTYYLLHKRATQAGNRDKYFCLDMPKTGRLSSPPIFPMSWYLKRLMSEGLSCHFVICLLPSSLRWKDFEHRRAIRSVLLEMRSLCREQQLHSNYINSDCNFFEI